MFVNVLIPILILGVLGLIFGVVLGFAAKKLQSSRMNGSRSFAAVCQVLTAAAVGMPAVMPTPGRLWKIAPPWMHVLLAVRLYQRSWHRLWEWR